MVNISSKFNAEIFFIFFILLEDIKEKNHEHHKGESCLKKAYFHALFSIKIKVSILPINNKPSFPTGNKSLCLSEGLRAAASW